MLRILKSEALADLRYRKRQVVEQFLGMSQQMLGYECLSGDAGLGFHQFAEVSGREAAFVCEHCHGGYAAGFRFIGDVLVEHIFETAYRAVIDFFARDELALVEA